MDALWSRQHMRGVTMHLLLLMAIATLGSLQFGYHLASDSPLLSSPILSSPTLSSPILSSPTLSSPILSSPTLSSPILSWPAELNAPQDVITCRKKAIPTIIRVGEWLRTTRMKADRERRAEADCISMTEAAFATISSVFTVGGLVGALAAGPLSSRAGRLFAMRVTAVFYILGSAVETFAGSIWLMSLGRFVSGLGAGASTVVVPLYVSEIAPPAERGLFGAMTQASINLGILLTQTLGYFLSHGGAWRWILAIGMFIAVGQGLALFVVPESPAWLATHGDAAKAKRTLQLIRGDGVSIHEEVAAWTKDAAVVTSEEEGLLAQTDGPLSPVSPTLPRFKKPVHLGFLQVVRDPQTRPAIFVVVGIMVAQQFCGINSVVMYSVSLFADLLPTSSALLTILISVVNLAMTVACAPLPDRLGRKTCLLVSILGQGVMSLVLALSIVFGAKVVSAVAILLFVAFFAVGLGPVPFILASELVGQEAVGAVQSWCLAANYTATFFVAQFFPIVNAALNKALGGQGTVYLIFSTLAAFSAVFVFLVVPETKGRKDPEDIWARSRRLD
ncbi:MFS glucose transporter [Drechmeria coniospora]|uniref:MFS glucose transporter n=1 Tax=Drechmeria coniospora TaxID=98403 RepID=A0A151GAA8_DRECN|nr:MFS glucose transporter [Drechmeria coniospora]KYK54024.1 MFS glucose transporter [Drechmeria coniospora]